MSRRKKRAAPAAAPAVVSPVKPPQVVGMLESSPRKFLGMDFDEIVSQVSMLQMATSQIPALAADHVRKAWRQMERTHVDRGPKAMFIDPFDTATSALGWKERRSGFGFEVLKEVERQLAVVRAIVNVRCAQASAFAEPYDEANNLGYTVTMKDRTRAPSLAARKRARDITSFIAGCGQPRRNPQSQVKRDRFDVFMRKIVRDSLVFDSVGIEIVPDEDGTPFEFYALDGTTLRFAPSMDEQSMGYDSGSIAARVAAFYDDVRYDPMAADGNPARFIQVVNNQPVASFSDRELIYGVRNPRSDIYVAGYGYSELEQAISIVTALVDTEKYQSNLFRNGTMPRGILNLKGTEWTPDQMECVPEDTAVYTDRGALPIRAIFDRQVSGEKFRFWNGLRFADGFASESDEKKILNLRCVDGTDFRCSPNHRMFVMTDDGIVERFASDLAPGDLLLQNESVLQIEEDALSTMVPSEWAAVSQGGKGRPFSISEIGADLWEVIGWMVGDGWMSANANQSLLFYHAKKDMDAFAAHQSTLAKYGVNFKLRDTTEDGAWQIVICHKAFNQFLAAVGVGKLRDKKVPWVVFRQTEAKRGAFLRGLYSADGYVSSHGYSVGIFSKYPTLLDGIQQLLLTLGLPSYRVAHADEYNHEDKLPQIFVRRREDFAARVGFVQQYKNDKIAPTDKRKRFDPVPVGLLRKLMAPHRAKFSGRTEDARAVASLWQAEHRIVSRRYWKDMLESLGDTAGAESLAFRPVELERVWEVGHAPTLDITIVGDEPRFVAEGFITHNSLKRAWSQQLQGQGNAHRMPIIQFDGDMQFVNMQASHRDMEYSRYHEFLVALLCGVYLCDPEEIALSSMRTSEQTPLFSASSEWKLKASRDRGLKPLLRFLAGLMQQIVDQIDDAFQFRFLGLDEPSEQDKHQRRLEELSTVKTLDEVRAAMGLPLYHDRRVGQMIMSPTLLQATKLADEQDMMTAQRAAPVAPTPERERNDDAGTSAHLS